MPRVTTNPQQKLQRGQWPQDTLNPPVLSNMPPVSSGNLLVRRESFAMAAKFLQVGYGIFQTVIQIPAYGDFWCRSIAGYSPVVAAGSLAGLQPFAYVQVTDTRTNYKFFEPHIAFPCLVGSGPQFTIPGLPAGLSTQTVFNGHATSDLPQPYCFTRNSSILISINRTNIGGSPGTVLMDFYFSFGGWLEYTNASG